MRLYFCFAVGYLQERGAAGLLELTGGLCILAGIASLFLVL